ncbi:MAG: hypothetical protein V4751_02535 [Pseudomonadota bacterium]
MTTLKRTTLHLLLLTLAIFTWPTIVTAQDYVEWSTETRTSLGFRVNAASITPLLPEEWSVATIADSPGLVNLSVTFMDRHLVLDAQGQPVRTGTSRYMVMSVQARNANGEQVGTMIVNGISAEGPGAYEVYQQAVVAEVERTTTGQGEESGLSEETWQLAAESGDSVTLNLRYRKAAAVRRQSEVVIRSGSRPEFTRTYHIDQASDVLGLPDAPDSRIEQLSFTVAGPLFSQIFDGTEVLTGVTAIPWYSREIFIP